MAPYWQSCLEEKAVLANIRWSGLTLVESPRHLGVELEPSRILSCDLSVNFSAPEIMICFSYLLLSQHFHVLYHCRSERDVTSNGIAEAITRELVPRPTVL